MSSSEAIYGLVGQKLGHSFSANFFNKKFQKENIKAEYINIELESIEDFPEYIGQIPNLKGFNVTIPYKESVIKFLDDCSNHAKEIGAVNTIKFDSGKLIGHNTDWFGFSESLKPFLREDHKKALVLGSGGSSKAIQYALSNLGIENKIVSRNPSENKLSYNDLDRKLLEEHTVIINTTPLGMFPNVDVAPELDYSLLGSKHLLYDLVYNPEETLFLRKGKAQACQIKNGLEMLELQALAAWDIWNS